MEFQYVLANTKQNSIELPELDTESEVHNISVCSDNGVCASEIEVEYDE